MSVEIIKVTTGYFKVLKDGEVSKYVIFNGSRGLSGNGKNVYGIETVATGQITWVGSLAKAKKQVTFWLQ